MSYSPQTVTIRHGLFWYFSKEKQVLPNPETGLLEEKTALVQRSALQNATITLDLESDYNRGVEHHAFWTEDDLKSRAGADSSQLPAGSGDEDDDPDEPKDPTEVPIGELSEDDLVEWLQATGEFDGYKQPNAEETVAAVGEDAELASRVLSAEKRARDKPRASVEKPLTKMVEEATA